MAATGAIRQGSTDIRAASGRRSPGITLLLLLVIVVLITSSVEVHGLRVRGRRLEGSRVRDKLCAQLVLARRQDWQPQRDATTHGHQRADRLSVIQELDLSDRINGLYIRDKDR